MMTWLIPYLGDVFVDYNLRVIQSKDECSVLLITGRYLNGAMAKEYSAIAAMIKTP